MKFISLLLHVIFFNLNYWDISIQVNEEASDKVLEIEQKYNEIKRPVYAKRGEIIKCIPDFWLTAVSHLAVLLVNLKLEIEL